MRPYMTELKPRVEARREKLHRLLAELQYEGRWSHTLASLERELRLVGTLTDDSSGDGWTEMSALTALRLSQWLTETELLAHATDAELDFDLQTTAVRIRPSGALHA